MDISIVVAMSNNGVIGKDGTLPWRLSADLRHFKAITMGKPIIMGRVTHESIGKPLPGRENIVLTRNADYVAEGCTIMNDFNEIYKINPEFDEIMVIGGSQLYAETLARALTLFITEVDAEIEGDTFFPAFDRSLWREIERNSFKADELNEFDYSFVVLKKIQ